ncbi:myelin and lymphocyte protein-like isoform X2 [Scyliorhinus canicula]|uniref:myelin and lymphocyte protein-like isoform X2 n=1 Tax=Scyliorhinus canicula TaxID=7830 RepID=UPI0018F74074|nr:myelin and lymphocyte protein-like isoform X2 [Scyliorhinus canicula]
MSAPAAPNSPIPSGLNVLLSFPEVLMIGEFVFGGLVWILVASSKIPIPDLQGWLMFVSVFCFIITTLLFILYMVGVQNSSSSWTVMDVIYHIVAAAFYLSVAVMEATHTKFYFVSGYIYKINIAASSRPSAFGRLEG